MRVDRCFAITCASLFLTVTALFGSAAAQSQSKASKYACSEPKPAQLCTAANTCGSTGCSVDVKRTSDSASATPSIPGAKGNALFCVKVGTTVTWKSTEKDNGFVVDVGPSSPFDPPGAIIGGSDRSVAVVAKRTGCFNYSAGACRSGSTYGMCDTANAKVIVIDGN